MKFGKQIQKKQLEIPEYAASFVDYKALKKLIKELKNSPIIRSGVHPNDPPPPSDTQSVLQANKAPFFFRLDRELDKVNAFYTVKEAESKVRLRVLMDKQRAMRLRHPSISRTSSNYVTLEQGFKDFIKDLNKLQQFIEINATAFSKILKKWDKTSKSQTKELYLSRAVEVQPCFNHDVISELSDQAQTSLLDCTAWAEGDPTQYSTEQPDHTQPTPRLEQDETDTDLLETINRGDVNQLRGLLNHILSSANAAERLTKAFLAGVSMAPADGLHLLLQTGQIDLNFKDEINDRTCLHKTAMTGRLEFLRVGLAAGVDVTHVDAYGRIPLHYACMNGHVSIIDDLVKAKPETADAQDLDNFTPLIHGIVHGHLKCVEQILSYHVRVDPSQDTDHIPMNLACQYGSFPIVELLLRGKPKIMPDAEGLYPQHLVARFGRDPQILLMLREYGASLDQPDKLYQWTPLFHAASEGRNDSLSTLLASNVNVHAKDEKGLSALYYATWEGHMQCMATLASVAPEKSSTTITRRSSSSTVRPADAGGPLGDIEVIPDLSLPPPIIPTRRYGHNFLESKTTVVISFEELGRSAVMFYDESKYPAARLTIAPRSSDILPRNLLLPLSEDNRHVSFEMARLENFAIDFDIYPTFGKKVIAKGSVPSEVFGSLHSSSGNHHLTLLDPRLRAVGQLCFRFQVIKPFSGKPLDITPFATYWKATSQLESKPSALVTGSSLSGEYMRISVQITQDGVPVVHPHWLISHAGIDLPVLSLTYAQFKSLGNQIVGADREARFSKILASENLSQIQKELGNAFISLESVLSMLPVNRHVNLHLLYPTEAEELRLHLGRTGNLNNVCDNLLHIVFRHARHSRGQPHNMMRSIVFTSYNKDLCTALNWKQPNYPVLLCNDLGADASSEDGQATPYRHNAMSIKEAVRIAQSNNFMGLTVRSRVLELVPALVEAIKVAGLVLVSDATDSDETSKNPAAPPFDGTPEGIDGILRPNGIMRFQESIDI